MLEFLTISLIISLAVISPGPDFVIVSRNALSYSQKIGVMTALGIACSTLFHASYCILGFAIIVSKSLILFNIIKYVGASYLIYLGIKGLLDRSKHNISSLHQSTQKNITIMQAFNQGLLCNALNPKTILFFLALFTMVIKPTMSWSTQIGYALEIALLHFIWFTLISTLFSHNKVKLFMGKFLHYITKMFGGLLVLFGLKIATLSNN